MFLIISKYLWSIKLSDRMETGIPGAASWILLWESHYYTLSQQDCLLLAAGKKRKTWVIIIFKYF